MAREIKFRGWHTLQGKMYSPDEMGIDQLTIMPNGTGFINVNGHNVNKSVYIRAMIPMQFTGLKDKNGKEIYESDVIEIHDCECTGHDKNEGEIWESCKGKVFFEDSMFVFEGHSAGALPLCAYKGDLTVIGNIHENPELLCP